MQMQHPEMSKNAERSHTAGDSWDTSTGKQVERHISPGISIDNERKELPLE